MLTEPPPAPPLRRRGIRSTELLCKAHRITRCTFHAILRHYPDTTLVSSKCDSGHDRISSTSTHNIRQRTSPAEYSEQKTSCSGQYDRAASLISPYPLCEPDPRR